MSARTAEVALRSLPRVVAGAGVSVLAPAAAVKAERARLGEAALREAGFAPRFTAHAMARGPLYFAGSVEARLSDLHAAFADAETSLVMALRGGYGSNYLLEQVDWELIGQHPKPFFGYSDLTGLQLAMLDRLGIPAFHGPMLAADFSATDGVHAASFLAALEGRSYSVGANEGLRVLKAASEPVRGVLYGGCLSILVAMLGTPWEPQTEGKLLFLEDVGAKPYQVDRMLWQLRQAGKLDGVKGIVFGEMLDCHSPGAAADLVEQAILNALDGLNLPMAIGLRSGHVSKENVTLVFGAEAELSLGEEPRVVVGRGTQGRRDEGRGT